MAALPTSVLWALIFLSIALTHASLLQLPYFWDEGGYYIPAALDFFHTGALVPHFTNAHPPLPNILLGTLWHLVGFHILATRLLVCAFAAAGLTAVFRLTQALLTSSVALAVTLLTAIYPIWFAQSTLAHADIFAAAFTLWALALYLPRLQGVARSPQKTSIGKLLLPTPYSLLPVCILFSLAALSKETSILQPVTLAALELLWLLRDRRNPLLRRIHARWLLALLIPVLPLVLWYLYHWSVTGFVFGNPEFLRYNATANLTASHFATSLWYRFLHLFWQRNIWLPILLALGVLLLPLRHDAPGLRPLRPAFISIAILVAANWIAFSILGGALLTRYLLPIYPLILLVCVALWHRRTRHWIWLTALTFAVFLSGLWINPPTSFAPEDTLTYRDMIVVHQEAIDYVATHYPGATILTAWPVAADVFRPELGYVTHPLKAVSIDDFTLPNIRKAAQEPDRYDTAIVFATHYTDPSFRRWLLAHSTTPQGRTYAATRDLTPEEIAAILGGTVVWQDDHHGEWAAVLRFNRSYEARLLPFR